jgi:hypothetical protein
MRNLWVFLLSHEALDTIPLLRCHGKLGLLSISGTKRVPLNALSPLHILYSTPKREKTRTLQALLDYLGTVERELSDSSENTVQKIRMHPVTVCRHGQSYQSV